jgi:predicted  nucleic acid-binding Zn-ribbon protein
VYECLECGHKFKRARSAERASIYGCPGCGGVDIDLDVSDDSLRSLREMVAFEDEPRPKFGRPQVRGTMCTC